VTVHQQVRHPIYKKSFRKSKKFLADTKGIDDLMVGDLVIITECRPLSKNKHFKVTEVTKRTPRVSEMKEEESGLMNEKKVRMKKDTEGDEVNASAPSSPSKS
jgi:small subunit ribosomal protein S17